VHPSDIFPADLGHVCFADMNENLSALESRVQGLIDDRLFAAYWDAVTHYETKDLVLIFNAEEQLDPVTAAQRVDLLEAPGIPEALQTTLQKPASEAAKVLHGSDAFFWLVAIFPDEEMACVAVNAKPMALGGGA
jgi:hypothetical protein